MKVIGPRHNPGTELASGLASLLAGVAKESFASLLDGDEPIGPELDPHVPEGRQGDQGRRMSRKESDHGRKAEWLEHQGRSGITGLGMMGPAPDLRPDISLDAPCWNAKSDTLPHESSVGLARSSKSAMMPAKELGRINSDPGDLSGAAVCDESDQEDPASFDGIFLAEQLPHKIDKTSEMANLRQASSSQVLNPQSAGISAQMGSGGDPSDLYGIPLSSRGNYLQIAGIEKTVVRPAKDERVSGAGLPREEPNETNLIAGTDSTGAEPQRMSRSEVNGRAALVNGIDTDVADRPGAAGSHVHPDVAADNPKGSQESSSSSRTPEETGAGVGNFERVVVGQRIPDQVGRAQTPPSTAADSSVRPTALPHAADGNMPRVLANAMRGELHVGVRTEAFGRVTIQTSAGSGQFSAQVSLEDSKQSAALAAHFPAVEQRITQQHGVNASVRIATDWQMGSSGSSTASGQRGSSASGGAREERHSGRPFEVSGSAHRATSTSRSSGGRLGGNLLPGRLDVMV